MAHAKVIGVETEYGIVARGIDITPMTASSLLVNAFSDDGLTLRAWDFASEQPAVDARDGWRPEADYPEVDVLMANSVLSNGARYYVDHAHPEMSTPECASPLDVVLYDRAGEEIIRESMKRANQRLGRAGELIAHKNNSDGKGNSYGCHENYLVPRFVPFGQIASAMTAHFVSRQIFCGAGKVGVELAREGEARPSFQLSQRADFFEEVVGLETTVRRPIINTRDEPHADPERWRRLHVIAGDANMSEVATYLKVGTTALVLSALEDGALVWPELADPVAAIRSVSHDTTLRQTIATTDGRTVTALDLQWRLLESVAGWFERGVDDPVGGCARDVMRRWEIVLGWLESNDRRAAKWVDWVAERHGLGHDHPKLRAVDLQYHDMRGDRCLALRAGLDSLVDEVDVARAVFDAPTSTRAYFRGECIKRWPETVVSANWDGIVFDTGGPAYQRVPTLDPLKGTHETVGALLDAATTVTDLLDSLGAGEVEDIVHEPGW
ncbi:MAG: proteasome accessory factor PafA2 family protein [Ilumatobacteraceae bacterium]